ncbi:MFS transporter [Rhodobacter sp. KR11]|jgi:MFS family permease|uniref:MFS transporter n=1 Tax=Rhodobacter sp. KR11 TaxID=2974588 RepID=UPI0022221A35|nr:MFS transporter [Rhodobacter sp. KR11]MCW1918152.1 MFS transporter [Rhodobacter sp. KR11]
MLTLTFRRLFLAQLVALTGTGLATVALGLLAWNLAGDRAGAVLGTALAIKMVAYVGLAPLASALADRLPRRGFLVGLDLIRAGAVALMPFVTTEGQIYALIFVLQAAQAGFTPAFQSTLPDVLPDPRAYTRGLSLMRLAEDLEQIASPLLAAALLTFVSFPLLFAGTVLGFLASAALVLGTALPPRRVEPERFFHSLTKGLAIYARTPRLRGLLALEGAVAAAGAMVYVNTVVLVQAGLHLPEGFVALAFAAFGAGSMAAALALPRVLETRGDRGPMLAGAGLMLGALALLPLAPGFAGLAGLWALIGAGFAATQIPIGRIVTRSCRDEDRGAVFAAQFALSHACWLVAYPLAGWLGPGGALALAGLGALAWGAGLALWPAHDPARLAHAHPDLAPDHPHLVAHDHDYVIDPLHRHWPSAPHAAGPRQG